MTETMQKILALMRSIDAVAGLLGDCLTMIPLSDEANSASEPLRNLHSLVRQTTLFLCKDKESGYGGEIETLPFDTLRDDIDSDNVAPEMITALLEKTCNLVDRDIITGLTDMKSFVSRVTGSIHNATNAQLKAVQAADALHDENESLTAENQRLYTENKALHAKVSSLHDQVSEFKAGDATARKAAEVPLLKTRITELETEAKMLRQAHRGRNIDEEHIGDELASAKRHILELSVKVDELEEMSLLKSTVIETLHQVKKKLLSSLEKGLREHKGIRQLYGVQQTNKRKSHFKSGQKKYFRRDSNEARSVPAYLARRLSIPEDDAAKTTIGSSLAEDIRLRAPVPVQKPVPGGLENRIIQLQAENDELHGVVRRLEQDLEDLFSNQGHASKLTTEIKAKTALITKLRSALSEQEQTMSAQKIIVTELRQQLTTAKAEIQALQVDIQRLESEVSGHTPKDIQDELASETVPSIEEETVDSSKLVPAGIDTSYHEIIIKKLKGEYEKLISRMETAHQRALNEGERQKRLKIEETRSEYLSRLTESQTRMNDVVKQLHFEIEQLKNKHDFDRMQTEDVSVKNRKKAIQKESKLNVSELPNNLLPLKPGEFTLDLPGAAASVRIPLASFHHQDVLILHVAFPAQRLVIQSDRKTFKLLQGAGTEPCTVTTAAELIGFRHQ